MKNINLGENEGILLQTEDVVRYLPNNEETEIDKMYLTNENIVITYEKSNGLFSDNEDVVDKIPLSKIKVVNNKAQVFKIDDDDYGLGLQIHYKNGNVEHYTFDKKKDLNEWYFEMIETLTGEIVQEDNSTKDKSIIATSLLTGLKNTAESTKKAITNTKKSIEDVRQNKNEIEKSTQIEEECKYCTKCGCKIKKDIKFCSNCGNSIDNDIDNKNVSNIDEQEDIKNSNSEEKEKKQLETIRCPECGEELPIKSKFCNYCGSIIDKAEKEKKKIIEEETEITERKTVYEGKIHKCPNCGETLKAFEINCPSCGFEIRGAKNSSAVEKLSAKLEEIEKTREKKKTNAVLRLYNLDDPITKTDEQKISVIRNFPIPNTKEDLYEFLILSKSNIDVSSYTNQGFPTARKAISDAWKAKFDQAYQKAKLLLKDDERLSDIDNMYNETEKSISKSKNQIWIILGVTLGIMILVSIITFIPIIFLTNNSSDNSSSNNNSQITENNNKKEKEKQKEEIKTNKISETELNNFTKGYEKAEFDKYNSFASENGLGGKRIYFKCKLDETEVLEADGTKTILGYVTDEENNKWLIHLHFIPAVSAKYFDNYIDKEMYLRGVYEGYSSVKEMPSVTMDEILIVETGEEIPGMQQIIDKGDN